MPIETWLPFLWAAIIALAVFFYVCMDGFDLGLGILFPLIRDRRDRDVMVNSVAPVWDGNETWLVMGGGGLLAVFPLAYALILPALYAPLIAMLLALIFRGVSFEMRFKAETREARIWWDRAFSWGSFGAAVAQGLALGAIVQGIRVANRAYAGGWWDWLTPFTLFTAASLVVGYALLGACWLVWKTEGALQDRARALARSLGWLMLVLIAVLSCSMPFLQPAFRARWFAFPEIILAAPVPILVALLAWRFFRALEESEIPDEPASTADGRAFRWRDGTALACVLGWFFLCYTGLGISLYPFIVPPSVTIWDAAAAPGSQLFLLVGAAVLIPTILCYTGYSYWLFRGKVRHGQGYH